ncbi:hypothetical protein T484DRAFT_1741111 [Baffinella frigidus]|nr:hypothetical protein T484DRAFT_1741111 [Cryptophyta sp. CCMP2293]
MPHATSACSRRYSLATPPAFLPLSEPRPQTCNRDSFLRRRNSHRGFRATTSVDDAPHDIKDSMRKRRLSIQPISEVSDKSGFRQRRPSVPIAALPNENPPIQDVACATTTQPVFIG